MKAFYRNLLICALLAAPTVQAGTATVSWSAVTACVDGSAVVNCPISGYRVYGATQGAPKTVVANVTAAELSAAFTSVPPGVWCYDVTALSGAVESAHSVETCKTVVPVAPAPPSLVTVTVAVYDIRKSTDKLTLVAVGTVPLGTPCKTTMGANGQHVVPRAAVTWTSTTHPLVVVAECG